MEPETGAIEAWALLMGVAGGLALFLFGMDQLTQALKHRAGGRLQALLARVTANRFKGALAGAFVTAVVQSSSVTTVLVVGFISAGLMTFGQSIGFIMGANIGSTITAQIIAFKVTHYALGLIALGFAASVLSKRESIRQYGLMLLGLGLIFFGMDLMSEATRPLRSYAPFVRAMQYMDNPWLAVLASAAFTGIIQSSAATTGVVIVLAGQGLISLPAGILLIFGANIGTCVTALIASVGKPREAIRAAVVHVLFNVAGVLVWVAFVDQLASVVLDISGGATSASAMPRQIANAHSIFNVANTLLFIGLTKPLARLVTWMVPDRPLSASGAIEVRYLDDLLLDTPSLALDRVRMELRRLGERVHEMVELSLSTAVRGTEFELNNLASMDDNVDELHSAIIAYLGRLSQKNLNSMQGRRLGTYMSAANRMESMGDMVESNVVGAGLARIRSGNTVSSETHDALTGLHAHVTWSVQMAFEALDAQSTEMAQQVIALKPTLARLSAEIEEHLAQRLTAPAPDRLALFKIETEMIEYLKRVYFFAKTVAKGVKTLDIEPSSKDA